MLARECDAAPVSVSHRNRKRRTDGATDEPLVPIDDPPVASRKRSS